VGMSLTGALSPAGLGMSCLIPLVKNGLVDWVVSTGANLYHDTHFGIGLEMRRGHPAMDDRQLRERGDTSHVLLIALTGYGQSEDMRQAREAGFDLHLVKPVEPRRLDEALRALLPAAQP